MHDYDVYEALYLYCEMHGLWVIGLGPRLGPILPNRKINKILQYFLSPALLYSGDRQGLLAR